MANETTTIMLENGNNSAEYLTRYQADFLAAYAAYDASAIASNVAPYAVYMNRNRKQAWLCGWSSAAQK